MAEAEVYVVISLKCQNRCKNATYFIYNFLGSEGFQGSNMDKLNKYFKSNNVDPEKRFVNLFGKFGPLCGAAVRRKRAVCHV